MESSAIRAGAPADNAADSLSEAFMRYFTVAPATDEEMREAVFRIRYNVYCEEFGFEDPQDCPGSMERDPFDANSIHALITHKATEKPAACVRLVIPHEDIHGGLLPLEAHCEDSLDHTFINGLNLDRSSVCEISRLAVDGVFRRRPGENVTRYGSLDGLDCTQQERRTFSLLAVACFLSATALTDITGRTNVFAMMEPFLPRLLRRSGIPFHRAGEDVDYHGIRAPYFTTTSEVSSNLRDELSDLYLQILQCMRAQEREISRA